MPAAAISLPFAPVIASPCQHIADRRGRSTSVCAVAACNWRAVGWGLTNRGGREAVAYALCSTSRAGDAHGRPPAVLRTASSNRTLCALWCEVYESPTWIRSWISDACPTGRDSPRELVTRSISIIKIIKEEKEGKLYRNQKAKKTEAPCRTPDVGGSGGRAVGRTGRQTDARDDPTVTCQDYGSTREYPNQGVATPP
jgi:hypothetical protein